MAMPSSGEGWYLTDEEWLMKQNMRKFIDEEVWPRQMENETEETADPYYREVMKRAGEQGFLRLSVPEELGGFGMRFTASVLAVEEMTRGCGALGIHVLENPLFGMMMAQYAPAAWEKWGEKLLDGTAIYAGPMTAPEGNSNMCAWPAMVTKVDGGYMVNGEKAFCSGGTFADILTVQAFDADKTLYMLAFEPDTPGVTIHHNAEYGNSPTSASFTFKDMFVPEDWGGPMATPGTEEDDAAGNIGFKAFAIGCAGLSIGCMDAAWDMAVDYASKRESWGKKVIEYGAIQQKLVDMKIKIEAARSLTYTAARMLETGQKEWLAWADMAKIITSKNALDVTAECVELFGCLGVSPETGIMRHHLDSFGYYIGVGTPDIHYPAAAENLGWPASDDPARF